MASPEAKLPPPGLAWATLAIGALAVAAHVWPGALAALELNRDDPAGHGWWTWWTAHIVHYSGSHLFWNLAILMPAGIWAERLAPWRTRLFLVAAPFAISAVLLSFDRALLHYAGLSGLAAGVLAFLAWLRLGELERGARWFWRAVLAAIAVKIVLEMIARRPALAEFADDTILPVPLAHAAGVLCAAVFYVLPLRALHQRCRRAWRARRSRQAMAPTYGTST